MRILLFIIVKVIKKMGGLLITSKKIRDGMFTMA